MEHLIESILESAGTKEINLYFLLGADYLQKTVGAEAARLGFATENLHFTTENTKRHDLAGKVYMCSDELLYRHRNRSMPTVYHEQTRTKNFTALVRTHKQWRAYTMAKLWSKGLHEYGYFGLNYKI